MAWDQIGYKASSKSKIIWFWDAYMRHKAIVFWEKLIF